MAYSIIGNNRATRGAQTPAPQLKDDGNPYRFRLLYDEGRSIVDADTAAECLAVLIPGYLELVTEEERQDARERYIRSQQQHLRVRLMTVTDEAVFNSLEQWEQNVLSTFLGDVYGWADGADGWEHNQPQDEDQPDVWSAPVPLVLMEESYAPVGELTRPLSSEGDYKYVSNLVWLTARDEESLLRSLATTGLVWFGWSAGYDPLEES